MYACSICAVGICRQLAINFYYIWAHGHFPHSVPSNINIFRICTLSEYLIKHCSIDALVVRYTKISVSVWFSVGNHRLESCH